MTIHFARAFSDFRERVRQREFAAVFSSHHAANLPTHFSGCNREFPELPPLIGIWRNLCLTKRKLQAIPANGFFTLGKDRLIRRNDFPIKGNRSPTQGNVFGGFGSASRSLGNGFGRLGNAFLILGKRAVILGSDGENLEIDSENWVRGTTAFQLATLANEVTSSTYP